MQDLVLWVVVVAGGYGIYRFGDWVVNLLEEKFLFFRHQGSWVGAAIFNVLALLLVYPVVVLAVGVALLF